MPLSLAAVLGKTAPSVCLFGDSRQMPPIFRPELEDNVNSISILDYCSQKVEGVPVKVLHTTYRMNELITNVVSRAFYEPYGIVLKSAAAIAANSFHSEYLKNRNLSDSLIFMDTSLSSSGCNEENEGEASAIVEIVSALMAEGVSPSSLAVITPFRRQVRLLRSIAHEVIKENEIPLIDTVERLQGQDVDCIIISFASSDENYIKELQGFLFNPNRLNVMISRAKTKVIFFCSQEIQNQLKEILNMEEC